MSSIRIKTDSSEVDSFLKMTPGKIGKGLKTMAKQSLDVTENAQILAYGQNSGPPKPAGSTHTRTFKLKASSKRKLRVSNSGYTTKWFTDLSYAPSVLGKVSQQAPFNRGRWESIEHVTATVDKKLEANTDKIMSKVFR